MPISPDTRYVLDGGMMQLRLTRDIVSGAALSGIDVDAIHDGSQHDFYTDLTRAVLDWRSNRATVYEKASLAAAALTHSVEPMRELLWTLTGSIAEEWLARKGYESEFAWEHPRKRIAIDIPNIRFLKSRKMIETVAEEYDSQAYAQKLNEQHQRVKEALTTVSMRHFARWLRQQMRDRISPKVSARSHRQTRRAMRRCLENMARYLGPHAYAAFTSKEGLTIDGCLYSYNVRYTESIARHTANPATPHIPYRLELRRKEDGKPLGLGCVIFKDTPVLEQIIGLSLHVCDAESELALLRLTNWMFSEDVSQEPIWAILPDDARNIATARRHRLYVDDIDFPSVQLVPTVGRSALRVEIMNLLRDPAEEYLAELSGIPYSVYTFMSRRPWRLSGEDELGFFPHYERHAAEIDRLISQL